MNKIGLSIAFETVYRKRSPRGFAERKMNRVHYLQLGVLVCYCGILIRGLISSEPSNKFQIKVLHSPNLRIHIKLKDFVATRRLLLEHPLREEMTRTPFAIFQSKQEPQSSSMTVMVIILLWTYPQLQFNL